MPFEVNEVSLYDRGRIVKSGGSGSGGSGLPDEVITYEQFRAKSDSDQAAYTGYVTGWPGNGNGNIRYNPSTDYIQVYANGAWINCYYAGTQLDPTKMSLTQEEFIAICNQGLQSRMSIGAIIHMNNYYCSDYEVIDVNHDGTSNTVDVMAHTQVYSMMYDSAASNRNYDTSTIRTWINSTYLNSFDYEIRELMKYMQVPWYTGSGISFLTDKAKLLGVVELGVTGSTTGEGSRYPVFGQTPIGGMSLDRWRDKGEYGHAGAYYTRSIYSAGIAVVKYTGYFDQYGAGNNIGVLPVMRF